MRINSLFEKEKHSSFSRLKAHSFFLFKKKCIIVRRDQLKMVHNVSIVLLVLKFFPWAKGPVFEPKKKLLVLKFIIVHYIEPKVHYGHIIFYL